MMDLIEEKGTVDARTPAAFSGTKPHHWVLTSQQPGVPLRFDTPAHKAGT